jgi:formate dehydrogenase major subunit
MAILIYGSPNDAHKEEGLIDAIVSGGVELTLVCYYPQLGPIQTCDTCLVELDRELVRACAAPVSQGMSVRMKVFDRRIPGNHLLYCTACDDNKGNCTVHNTTKMLGVEHRRINERWKECNAKLPRL